MSLKYLTEEALDQAILMAIKEDIGDGDHSSLASIPADAKSRARLIVKADGVIAGLEAAKRVFFLIDPELEVEVLLKDGDLVKYGDIGLTVKGSARSILSAERLALNILQRMSGIATHTKHLVHQLDGTHTKLLDTRKTTPNFRLFEKWAVAIGGGTNHRFGLYDMVMLKDNHNDFAGGITKSVIATQKYLKESGKDLRIEVETRNLDEVKETLEVGGVDVIMLDNMSVEEMKEAVAEIAGKAETEASGGITEENIREVAQSGVDFISVGALTHTVKSLDISLKAY
ncbi:carboxylating nicotinate-nucleotide diphosphorylase [Aureibacter tunicatorum]|uniref:Probable nicotinate-nucleotide pyrophosphorylase [carboxylating] n=1 Tax=Aureibacter tunicatorum TaxID=866807 RepID=A0AAE3XLG2_9BACT|nr:carboxylating nicotinate-nucleotide diphosphorylase [Aureibacter tunicatorum]MDR6237124.1 nicotinate-nucleotide pyrophosphorylase (carboxylating) [Aureibacter tunicatorum]BDD06116.1 nicotinate-nucleotide diphosphorylase (carboxylating) [Aureibacter tunicatorum]